MQKYPQKAKKDITIYSIYTIINPKNRSGRGFIGVLVGLFYFNKLLIYHFTKSLGKIPNCF